MDNVEAAQRPALRLADHMRACAMNDQVILLDLKRSRYLALGIKQWGLLSGASEQHDTGLCDVRQAQSESDIENLAAPLLRQRVLTRSPTSSPQTDSVPLAEASLDVRGAMPFSSISAGRLWRFLAAAVWAFAALRMRSLRFAVDHVARRACRLSRPSVSEQKELRDAVAAFETLRPLLFTARDKCLYDSLALVSFLAGEGLRTQWVIGVKTQPFAAHSWVQADGVVLNDLHENVRRFKPILVA
jgi:hypothetical protein